jgi:hypothetical protein
VNTSSASLRHINFCHPPLVIDTSECQCYLPKKVLDMRPGLAKQGLSICYIAPLHRRTNSPTSILSYSLARRSWSNIVTTSDRSSIKLKTGSHKLELYITPPRTLVADSLTDRPLGHHEMEHCRILNFEYRVHVTSQMENSPSIQNILAVTIHRSRSVLFHYHQLRGH